MRFYFKFIILFFLAFNLNCSALEKETEIIANISASSLYNLNKKSLETTINSYIKSNPNLKALSIVEALSKETFYQMYKEDEKIYFDKEIPKSFKNYLHYKKNVLYNNEIVGEVTAYFSDEKTLNTKELKWIKNNPTIRLAYMNYWNTDQSTTNIHTEYIKLLSKYGDLNIIFEKFDSWAAGFEAAKLGKNVHGILNLSWSKEREKNSFEYCEPYFFVPSYIITKKENNKTKSIKDLINKSVFIKKDSITKQILQELKYNIHPIVLDSEINMLKALSKTNSKAEAIFTYTADNESLKSYGLKVADKFFSKYGEVYIGVSKKEKILQSILRKVHKRIPISELSAIQNKDYSNKHSSVKLSKEEKEYIKKNPYLKIDNQNVMPPLNYHEFGQAKGYSIDLIAMVAKRIGLTAQFIHGPTWNEYMHMIRDKKLDVMVNVVKNKERSKFMTFTDSYLNLPHGLITRKDDSSIKSFKDIIEKKKTITFVKGYFYEQFIKEKYPNVNLKFSNNDLESLQMLISKQTDVILGIFPNLQFTAKKNIITNVQYITDPSIKFFNPIETRIGVNKENKILYSMLQKGLATITPREYDNLANKWFGTSSKSTIDSIELTNKEREWLKKHPVLKVGYSGVFEPVFFKDELGNITGLYVDAYKIIEKNLGVKIEFILDTWDNTLKNLQNHTIDIIPGAARKVADNKGYLVASPYIKRRVEVFGNKKKFFNINSINDLKGKTVAYNKNIKVLNILLKQYQNDINFVRMNNSLDMLIKLDNNKVDAIIDFNSMRYFIAKNEYYDIQSIYNLREFSLDTVTAIRDDDQILQSIIQKALNSITLNQRKQINEKWFGDNQQILDLTKEEEKFIRNHPVVKVSNETDWPPFDFADINGNPLGMSIDYLKYISKITGLKFDFINGYSWDELIELFKEGKIDILHSITKTPQREKFSLFTGHYFTNNISMAINKNSSLKTQEDIKGKKVAYVKGYINSEYIEEHYPDAILYPVNNTQEALIAINLGKIDAFFESQLTMSYIISDKGLSNVKLIPASFNGAILNRKLYFAVQQTNLILHNILQKALSSMSIKTHQEIRQRWMLSDSDKKQIDLALTKKEKEWLNKKTPLKYVYDIDWAPFEWKNELGEHTGIIYDILNLIEERSGITFQETDTKSWAEAVELMKSNKVDMYSAVGENSEKKEYVNFSKNILFKTPYVFVVREGDKSDYFESFKVIKNKKVAVVKNYAIHGILKDKVPDIPLLTLESIGEGFEKVKNGEIDIFIVNATTAKYFINKEHSDKLKIATKTEFNLELKIALSKTIAPEALSIIDKAIKSIKEKEIDDIYFKWTEVLVEKKIDWTLVYEIGGGSLLLLLLIGYWNRKLKHAVDKKTFELKTLLKSFDKNVIASNSDLKGNITYASDALCEISGYSREELIGKPHNVLRHPDMPKDTFKALWITIQSGKTWRGEIKNRKKAGDFYWVYAVITPEFDKEKNIIGYSAIRQDITSKKEVEKLSETLEFKVEERTLELNLAKEQFESMVSNVPGAIYRVVDDSAWPIIYFSDEIKNITGYPAKDFMTSKIVSFSTIMHPDDVEPIGKQIQEQFAKGENFQVDYRVISKSGDIVWVRSQGQSVKSEDGKAYIDGVLIDITEAKEAEKEIDRQRNYIHAIMNSQTNMVISTDSKYLKTANKAFLNFYNVNDVPEFIEKYGDCICDTFDTDKPEEFIQKMMDEEQWLDYIENRPNQVHKAKITQNNIEHIFTITADRFTFNNEELKTAVFTDITQLEKIEYEIKQIHKKTQSSIEYASLIQHAVIPENSLFTKYFDDYLTLWQPKDIVGGDIYLFEELRNDDECMLMVIDCTGHGVPGAFVTMLVKAIERQIASIIELDQQLDISPAWILEYFNKTMKKLLKQETIDSISNAGFDGGIIYFNKKENIIKFAGAETSLFYKEPNNNEYKIIKGDRHSVGYKRSDTNYKFKDHIIDIQKGMQFFITTDGYLDQNGGERGFCLGKSKFKLLLEENANKQFQEQKEILLENLSKYQGNEERNDDITVIGIKI